MHVRLQTFAQIQLLSEKEKQKITGGTHGSSDDSKAAVIYPDLDET